MSNDELKSYREFHERNNGPSQPTVTEASPRDSYQRQTLEVAVDLIDEPRPVPADTAVTAAGCDVQPAVMPGIRQNQFTEKTNLLDT